MSDKKLTKARTPKKKPKTAKVVRGRPSQETIERRRAVVSELWVQGYRYAEITRELTKRIGEKWTRQTVANDVDWLRQKWEQEGSKLSAGAYREELVRMTREVFRTAMRTKKMVHKRKPGPDGKSLITSVMIDAPDLANANKAIERMGALRGLNVTTIDGQIGVKSLADFFGELEPDLKE